MTTARPIILHPPELAALQAGTLRQIWALVEAARGQGREQG
jgi:hypothetical protein